MRITAAKLCLVVIAFVLLGSIVLGQRSVPDLLLFNGKVFTSNSRQPYVERWRFEASVS